MKENTYDMAKVITEAPYGQLASHMQEKGFGEVSQAVVMRDLAEALIAVWDGKASTLDQAAAWREVHKYMQDADLIDRFHKGSARESVLDAIGKLRREVAVALTTSVTIGEGEGDDAALERLLEGAFGYPAYVMNQNFHRTLPEPPKYPPIPFERLIKYTEIPKSLQGIDYASLEACVDAWRLANPDIVDLWAGIKLDRRRGLPESPKYWPTPREDGHVLYQTGDADAPEQIKDRNGEVVLAQCRHCGKAEIEIDGSQCPNTPVNHFALLDAALDKLAEVVEPARLDVMRRLLVLQDTCYGLAYRAGWWKDLETGEDVRSWPKKHFDNYISAKLMLIVTEVAEAMEGHRKGLMDTHLVHRGMLEVELADAVIRIMDLAGGLNFDVGGAIVEKLAYNMSRKDHQIENRKAEGGKSV